MKHLEGIGHRIELVKKHFNYSNEELGKVCGVSYAAIAKIINGATKDPSVSLFILLSKKLKININWLLFNEGNMLEEKAPLTKMIDNRDHIFNLQNKIETMELLLQSKNSEIDTLKKIINILEGKIEEKPGKKKAS